ncbi:MAG: hypothetical protein EH225_10930, partial [Calditrichaeota bacterium]
MLKNVLVNKNISVVLMLFLLILLIQSCDKNSTDPVSQDLQLSESTTDGLVSSWQVIHSMNSLDEVKELLSSDLGMLPEGTPGINTISQIRAEFARLQKTLTFLHTDEIITLGDSLLWSIDWTDPVSGVSVRKALYYNNDNGIARYYEAIYQFPNQLRLAYDSSEVKADLNFTLKDPADDRLLSLYKQTFFKEDGFVEKIEADAQATDWDSANQITGAVAHNHVWYGD